MAPTSNRLLLKVVTFGIVLDLAVSGVLYVEDRSINTNRAKVDRISRAADCWDHVLNRAVTGPQTPAGRQALLAESHICADLP